MLSIAGVVVLYHPDTDVRNRIETYLNPLVKLYVIDNTESSTGPLMSFDEKKITYIHDGQNKGIAARLNQAAALALQENYHWLLTMDQDSSFDSSSITEYLSCIQNFTDAANVAMFGVAFDEKQYIKGHCSFEDTDKLITSGSVVNLSLFSALQGFDEQLFIDEVDREYCFRAIVKGYRTVKFTNILLRHSLGNVSLHLSLKNFKYSPRTLHAPLRLYYMVRNFFYLRDKYGSAFKKEFKEIRRELMVRLKNNFLYRKDRKQLLEYTLRAYKDYKAKRMGKIISDK